MPVRSPKLALVVVIAALAPVNRGMAQSPTNSSPFTLHLGGQPNVSNYVEIVTNNGTAPLTGIALREINFPGRPGVRIHPVVRCRTHSPAVPVGGRWPVPLNEGLEIGSNQVAVEGAIFADGTTWGDAKAVSKLKEMASKCTGAQF